MQFSLIGTRRRERVKGTNLAEPGPKKEKKEVENSIQIK